MKVAILTTDNREDRREYDGKVPAFGTAPEALLQGFEAMNDIEVHVISCAQQKLVSPEKLAPNIWFHSLHVPKFGWLRTGYQGCVRAVRKKMREIRPDIVHGQGTERDCAISAVLGGFPNVLTIHGNMAEMSKLFPHPFGSYWWAAPKIESFALARTCGVLCNSAYTEKLAGPRTKKTWRVANPVREMFFTTPQASSGAPLKCTLLNVGVVNPRKRQVELLDLARTLHEAGFSFEVQFIGSVYPESEYVRAFKKDVAEAEKKGYARYLGMKTTPELVGCMDAAHGMVHFPSEEAFGLVVAEGLARGMKFFGSRTGGMVEIAEGAAGAELFGVEDWNGLRASLSKWLREGHPRPEGAGAEIERRYHPRIIAARHLEIYREVLGLASAHAG